MKEIFYFPKSDRKVIFALLCIAAAAMLLIYGLGENGHSPQPPAPDSSAIAGSSVHNNTYTRKRQTQNIVYNEGLPQYELFYFDPNTADSTALLRLGLNPWQVKNIYRYRARGGVYRKPSDFARLYGLTAKQYRKLEPYIQISDDYRPASELVENAMSRPSDQERHNHKTDYPKKLKPGERVQLSIADTSAFKRVPGIGSYFARRIVEYGQWLGGYHDVAQLMEIEDFPEEALDYFETGTTNLRRLNINRLSITAMRRHPYITFFQARAIADYRRLKGRISSIDELKLLKEFKPSDIERLRPYLEY